MQLYKYIKVHFNNSFYLRMLTLFSLTLLISLTLIISVFMRYQNRLFTDSKIESYVHSVDQFKIYSDHHIFEGVYTLITKDILNTSSSNANILFEEDSYIYVSNDFDNALTIRKYLYDIHASTNFIESISVYNKTHDTFIDSRLGAFYNISTSKEKYHDIIPYEVIEYILSSPTDQNWVPYNVTSSFFLNRYITTFAQHLPIFIDYEDSDFILLINIDLHTAYNSYITSTNSNKESFKLINAYGELLFDTNIVNDITPLDTLPLEEILAVPSGTTKITYDDYDTYVTWNTSSINNCTYIYSTIDDSTILNAFYAFPNLLGIILFLLICSLILTFYITKWLYQPVSNLVNFSRAHLDLNDEIGDLSTIHTAFSTLGSKVENLQSLLKKNDTLIFNNVLVDLINGKIEDIELLNERVQILGKQFELPYFYFIIIKVEEDNFEQFSSNDKEAIHLSGLSIIENFFDPMPKTSLTYLARFNYNGYFTCLVNTTEDKYIEELNNLNELLKVMTKTLDLKFNIAASDSFQDLVVSSSEHKKTFGYFKYSYIYGDNNIFTPSLIKEYETGNINSPQNILHTLETLLKANKFEELKEQLELLFQLIKSSGYSYLYTYNLFIQFISIIDRECKSQNISSEALDHVKLLEDFSAIYSLNTLGPWLNEIIDTFASVVSSRNESLHSALIHDIQDYIMNNVDDQLSLNSVSMHFGISTGHLSRMFKENTGANFSEFVSKAKFEKATKLLVEQPNLKISEISSQLGYSNVAYFTKLFKERYSMTPTQYRKVNR